MKKISVSFGDNNSVKIQNVSHNSDSSTYKINLSIYNSYPWRLLAKTYLWYHNHWCLLTKDAFSFFYIAPLPPFFIGENDTWCFHLAKQTMGKRKRVYEKWKGEKNVAWRIREKRKPVFCWWGRMPIIHPSAGFFVRVEGGSNLTKAALYVMLCMQHGYVSAALWVITTHHWLSVFTLLVDCNYT